MAAASSSGVAVAAKGRRGDAIEVVGVQVEGYTGMVHALGRAPHHEAGPTIAEGIAVDERRARSRARSSRELVDDLLVVRSSTSKPRSRSAAEIEKTVVEGAGAAGARRVSLESRSASAIATSWSC